MNEDLERLWAEAETFTAFMARVESQPALWEGVYRTAKLPGWATEAFDNLPHGIRMLVLNADWCLDSANTVPVLARLTEAVAGVELRLLERDAHLDVMDRYLTEGARSIPLVILLDRDFRPLGRWGPRPAELQAWVLAHKESVPKEERYKEERKWYARDRGETTLREILKVASRP